MIKTEPWYCPNCDVWLSVPLGRYRFCIACGETLRREGRSLLEDIKRNIAYMIMDASQSEYRRYWNGYGWCDDPCEAMRKSRVDGIDSEYFGMIDDGCQAALVQVDYSRVNGTVAVYNIRFHHKVTHE